MGTSNASFTVRYTASSVNYTVRHMWQDTTGTGYTVKETETLSGATGSLTQAVAKVYAGFYVRPVLQASIAADGSTAIEVKYDRAIYAINFVTGAEGATITPIEGRYGASVAGIVTDAGIVTRPGYTFLGWDWNGDGTYNAATDKAPTTIPNGNTNVNAVWRAGTAAYKIVYWSENANDDGYSWLAT